MRAAAREFLLAPMDGLMLALTTVALGVPVLLLLGASRGPAEAGSVLQATGLSVVVLYAFLWLWMRPGYFEVDEGVHVVWPIRTWTIPAARIRGAAVVDADCLRDRFGCLVRVGAGGLWGAFGYLWSPRGAWLPTYISRTSGLVLVELADGDPVLLSPEAPEAFVAAVEDLVRSRRTP